METLSRKQREIQEREALILEVAREMLLERGYLGVTMDRIAQAIEYSKGTVYQHFSSKEDVLVALAGQPPTPAPTCSPGLRHSTGTRASA